MPRFNFNEITKSGKADIDKIGENFEEIEANGITEAEVDEKVGQDNFKQITASDAHSNRTIYITRRGKVVTMHIGLSYSQASFASNIETLISDQDFENWYKPSQDYKVSDTQIYIPVCPPVFDAPIAVTVSATPTSYILPHFRLRNNTTAFQIDKHKVGDALSGGFYEFNFAFSYAVD